MVGDTDVCDGSVLIVSFYCGNLSKKQHRHKGLRCMIGGGYSPWKLSPSV